MKTTLSQPKQKRIEDLSLQELDMIYSLTRIGDFPASEIGRRYKVSQGDVRKVIDNYVELRKMAESQPRDERLQQDPAPELNKKLRKRRSDARYGSDRERQAAYRNRLRERRRAGAQQPSPDPVTDSPAPAPADEELSVTTTNTL